MFCPNCGNNCGDAKFCPNCGTNLRTENTPAPSGQTTLDHSPAKTPPKSIYRVTLNGQEIDLLTIVGNYGCDTTGVYRHLKQKYGIQKEQAEELLAPYVAMKAKNSPRKSIFDELAQSNLEKKKAEKERRSELEASGQVYCPKCLSTSVSANQKGFGFVRGALGASVGLDVGMIAGGIGSKKIICTCLKCGYRWKPGKK